MVLKEKQIEEKTDATFKEEKVRHVAAQTSSDRYGELKAGRLLRNLHFLKAQSVSFCEVNYEQKPKHLLIF